MNKKQKLILTLIIGGVLLLSTIGTYAFFTSNANNNNKLSGTIDTGTMSLTFEDGISNINEKIMFGESVIKKFIIKNNGSLEASLSLYWKDLINTYTNGSLSYNLSFSTEENGTYTPIITETNMPVSSEKLTQTLASELSVPAQDTYYYNLTITLNHTDEDQTDDTNAVFNTSFDVSTPLKYRYYSLIVDLDGGTIGEINTTKKYLLQNKETLNIGTPSRKGYDFLGWNISGVSSTLVGETFTMGLGDTKLTAKWSLTPYTLTINPNGGEYNGETTKDITYMNPVDIATPTRVGHTFLGWDITGGKVENGKFILTEEMNASMDAKWQINNYKYIIYHNKMTSDGSTYDLDVADTGTAAYGTNVEYSLKDYTGFTAPEKEELIIGVENKKENGEDVYPPEVNKKEYNYARNQYDLTIDPNGGTYDGSTEKTVVNNIYYEATYPIKIPTKTGYNFTWDVSGADSSLSDLSLSDSTFTFTMGTENATLTANWTGNSYAVYFNANGGRVSQESKTVIYGSSYETLPTPTYNKNFTFLGWFTEKDGGSQVTASTEVETTEDQTLYAHWSQLNVFGTSTTLAALDKTSKGEFSNFKAGANTNETADGLYSMADDYGTSYYYRGTVTDNYVKFGRYSSNAPTLTRNDTEVPYAGRDMWWRIIRVNGDGSLRMIYDGTVPHKNGERESDFTDTSLDETRPYDSRFMIMNDGSEKTSWNNTSKWNNRNLENDAKYVGYMFGGANNTPSNKRDGTDSTAATYNETSSNMKNKLEEWYATNLLGYDEYIADAIYCNDRSVPESAASNITWHTGLGYGGNPTVYGAYNRFGFEAVMFNRETPKPQFICPQANDMFTKTVQTIQGKTTNGKLSQKIGLITADEIIIAGIGYLHKNDSSKYWTMTPYALMSLNDTVIAAMASYESLGGAYPIMYLYVAEGTYYVAPVISLKAEYAAKLIGSGTATDPYVIPGVN